ncbi:MAG: hypothetical protein ABEI86_08715 [Halobacteriaceae archaeon]
MPATDVENQQAEATGGEEIRLINRSSPPQKWRYTCPNGHVDRDQTNPHIWCKGCRRAYENGMEVDPEHWHLIDQKTGEEIAWENVRVVE